MANINTKMNSMGNFRMDTMESSGYLKLDPDWTNINSLNARIPYFIQMNNYEDYVVGEERTNLKFAK